MSTYELTLVAAIGPDRGLGKDGSLIYKSSADMRWSILALMVGYIFRHSFG
jgi:hypothetical protein